MTKTIKLAVIAGDGIGKEVTAQSLLALEAATAKSEVVFELTHFNLGAEHYLETGETLPEETLAAIKEHDAILFGAVGGVPGDARLRGANIERGLLLKLRFELDHYVNYRPSKLYPGVNSVLANPGEIDFVVVREGTEGAYTGAGGSIRVGTEHEVSTEVSVNTAYGVSRVVRFAFEQAMKRRKKLTVVHKNNVLIYSGELWRRVVAEVQTDFPGVEVDYMHIDAATIHMVQSPDRFDVIVTDNLFGDIITDLAAAISGGIGLATSGNINPSGKWPSMFEPVHGSAPDIAGTNTADPSAAILSVAVMLEHLELATEAKIINEAVAKDIAQGLKNRSTTEIGAAIVQNILH